MDEPRPLGPPFRLRLWLLSRLPLGVSLRILRWAAPRGRLTASERRWAEQGLGLAGADLRAWAARAWWGRQASKVIGRRIGRGHTDEIDALLAPVDWSVVEAALAHGRGALLVGAHVGPMGVVPYVVGKRFPRALFLLQREEIYRGLLDVRTLEEPSGRGVSLAAARLHLRRGGVVFLAADGVLGTQSVTRALLGGTIELRRGAMTLARLSGASAIPTAVGWAGGRLALEFAAPIAPRAAEPEAWQQEWCDAFVVWLTERLRGPAENHRLTSELWKPGR